MSESTPRSTALEALAATVPLARLPRTGWVMAGISDPETIAAHSHGVCLVVLALGPKLDPPIDVDRAVVLATVHDVPEALLSDLPRPAARLFPAGSKQAAERAAAAELLGSLSSFAHERFLEYAGSDTREARFVKLCDRLHMGVTLVAYLTTGARGLDDFVRSIADCDASEFAPCEALRLEILQACEERTR